MAQGGRVSFNFNKFRSMLLRIEVGVQLDGDMLLGQGDARHNQHRAWVASLWSLAHLRVRCAHMGV